MKQLVMAFLLVLTSLQSFGQSSGRQRVPIRHSQVVDADGLDQAPPKTLEFKAIDLGSGPAISPLTTFPPRCSTDGKLFIDMLDPKDLKSHTVLAIRDKKADTYSPSAISDLKDVLVRDFFPTDSAVYFLVRGSKEASIGRGPGKSPEGIPWTTYHNYVAKFDNRGTYMGSTELSVNYDLSHIAVFPSGDFLVTGYDRVNSTIRLLYLNSSGEVGRILDLPAARGSAALSAPFDSVESVSGANGILGSVLFTPYGQGILVWSRNGNNAILQVRQGGGVREVPLQVPPHFVFVDMISSNDRWVAHFRSDTVPQDSPLSQDAYAYYELRPQDASLSAKLIQSGVIPLSLACENDGKYVSFERADDGKLILLEAE